MDSKRLNELWDELHKKESELIGIKAGEYATGDERLHNFNVGSELMGCEPYQTAFAYLTKHIISVQKAAIEGKYNFSWAVKQEDGSYTEGIIQKIVDARNYLFLMLCCMEEKAGIPVNLTIDQNKAGEPQPIPAILWGPEPGTYDNTGNHLRAKEQ